MGVHGTSLKKSSLARFFLFISFMEKIRMRPRRQSTPSNRSSARAVQINFRTVDHHGKQTENVS